MPPAPGAQVSVESLAEACRMEGAELETALKTVEEENWLERRDERTWELTLVGARAVEGTLSRKDQSRARRIRAEVLAAVCHSDTAERDLPMHYRQACAQIDAQSGEIRAAIRWLVAEGHLHWYHVGGYVSCTLAGKDAQRTATASSKVGTR